MQFYTNTQLMALVALFATMALGAALNKIVTLPFLVVGSPIDDDHIHSFAYKRRPKAKHDIRTEHVVLRHSTSKGR
ncbi:unnamed protein product [Zymoseptoria tritici ST99CH_3D7]|uniref:Uncharacterized protein n=1 Tax=Zymoseptoria tritici (strain ST99CH_3D7) TaxID=1276538 RepID=A0A1X7RPZ4_ZYMT9|nr:unnamed protein product [Zymoseptoria tritici ST99CH_3D7]